MQKRRWIVLASFMGVAAVSQMLWLNFAPILTMIQKRYAVSELLASMLILCFPLLYVVFSMPAGAMTDRRGYRFTIKWGSLLMAAGSLVRVFDESFYALLAGQLAIAVAQPYIINGITKLAADWFPETEQALATGLGTAGMFIGMAIGMASTAPLTDTFALRGAMIIFALLTILATAAFVLLARENEHPATAQLKEMTAAEEFSHLIRNRDLLPVFVLSFLALGFFNGLTTWLESILGEHGVSATDAGLVGGALIIGGIVGSLLIPALSDRLQRRKPFLIVCSISGAVLAYPLCVSENLTLLYLLAALLGALFLPGYALLLAMSEEIAGKARAGGAAGLLMLAGNSGGVVIALLMQGMHNEAGWSRAVLFMMGLLLLVVLLAFFSRESIRQREIDA